MEPKFQTSFIPKKSIIEASKTRFSSPAPRGNNVFSIASTIIFLLTLLACGGLFIYKNSLISQIAKADKDLNDARAAFQEETIQNLMETNSRINAVKALLEKHELCKIIEVRRKYAKVAAFNGIQHFLPQREGCERLFICFFSLLLNVIPAHRIQNETLER